MNYCPKTWEKLMIKELKYNMNITRVFKLPKKQIFKCHIPRILNTEHSNNNYWKG